jgi:hypothetical protein
MQPRISNLKRPNDSLTQTPHYAGLKAEIEHRTPEKKSKKKILGDKYSSLACSRPSGREERAPESTNFQLADAS